MKPLYLNGGGVRVQLDGPALRVLQPERAARWFPLARLSRVVASGAVDWSTPALLACAQRGISVTFLDRYGALQGLLLGPGSGDASLAARLDEILSRPDWPARWEDWRRAMARRAQLRMAQRLGLKGSSVDVRRLKTVLDGWLQRQAGARELPRLEARLRGFVSALVVERLTAAGLDGPRLTGNLQRLGLVQALTELLAWELQAPLVELLQRARRGGPVRLDDRAVTGLFESQAGVLVRRCDRLLAELAAWSAELAP